MPKSGLASKRNSSRTALGISDRSALCVRCPPVDDLVVGGHRRRQVPAWDGFELGRLPVALDHLEAAAVVEDPLLAVVREALVVVAVDDEDAA